jgi:hypothetical protein
MWILEQQKFPVEPHNVGGFGAPSDLPLKIGNEYIQTGNKQDY